MAVVIESNPSHQERNYEQKRKLTLPMPEEKEREREREGEKRRGTTVFPSSDDTKTATTTTTGSDSEFGHLFGKKKKNKNRKKAKDLLLLRNNKKEKEKKKESKKNPFLVSSSSPVGEQYKNVSGLALSNLDKMLTHPARAWSPQTGVLVYRNYDLATNPFKKLKHHHFLETNEELSAARIIALTTTRLPTTIHPSSRAIEKNIASKTRNLPPGEAEEETEENRIKKQQKGSSTTTKTQQKRGQQRTSDNDDDDDEDVVLRHLHSQLNLEAGYKYYRPPEAQIPHLVPPVQLQRQQRHEQQIQELGLNLPSAYYSKELEEKRKEALVRCKELILVEEERRLLKQQQRIQDLMMAHEVHLPRIQAKKKDREFKKELKQMEDMKALRSKREEREAEEKRESLRRIAQRKRTEDERREREEGYWYDDQVDQNGDYSSSSGGGSGEGEKTTAVGNKKKKKHLSHKRRRRMVSNKKHITDDGKPDDDGPVRVGKNSIHAKKDTETTTAEGSGEMSFSSAAELLVAVKKERRVSLEFTDAMKANPFVMNNSRISSSRNPSRGSTFRGESAGQESMDLSFLSERTKQNVTTLVHTVMCLDDPTLHPAPPSSQVTMERRESTKKSLQQTSSFSKEKIQKLLAAATSTQGGNSTTTGGEGGKGVSSSIAQRHGSTKDGFALQTNTVTISGLPSSTRKKSFVTIVEDSSSSPGLKKSNSALAMGKRSPQSTPTERKIFPPTGSNKAMTPPVSSAGESDVDASSEKAPKEQQKKQLPKKRTSIFSARPASPQAATALKQAVVMAPAQVMIHGAMSPRKPPLLSPQGIAHLTHSSKHGASSPPLVTTVGGYPYLLYHPDVVCQETVTITGRKVKDEDPNRLINFNQYLAFYQDWDRLKCNNELESAYSANLPIIFNNIWCTAEIVKAAWDPIANEVQLMPLVKQIYCPPVEPAHIEDLDNQLKAHIDKKRKFSTNFRERFPLSVVERIEGGFRLLLSRYEKIVEGAVENFITPCREGGLKKLVSKATQQPGITVEEFLKHTIPLMEKKSGYWEMSATSRAAIIDLEEKAYDLSMEADLVDSGVVLTGKEKQRWRRLSTIMKTHHSMRKQQLANLDVHVTADESKEDLQQQTSPSGGLRNALRAASSKSFTGSMSRKRSVVSNSYEQLIMAQQSSESFSRPPKEETAAASSENKTKKRRIKEEPAENGEGQLLQTQTQDELLLHFDSAQMDLPEIEVVEEEEEEEQEKGENEKNDSNEQIDNEDGEKKKEQGDQETTAAAEKTTAAKQQNEAKAPMDSTKNHLIISDTSASPASVVVPSPPNNSEKKQKLVSFRQQRNTTTTDQGFSFDPAPLITSNHHPDERGGEEAVHNMHIMYQSVLQAVEGGGGDGEERGGGGSTVFRYGDTVDANYDEDEDDDENKVPRVITVEQYARLIMNFS